jgi:hypothetical protein
MSWWCGAACAVAATAFACGGDALEETPGATWDAPAERVRVEDNGPPVIDGVRIIPVEPASGDRVRAIVRAREPDGQRVQLGFQWTLGGRPLHESAAEFELGEASRGERLEVVVTPSDGLSEGEPGWATAVVRNRRPVVVGVSLQPSGEVSRGEPLVAGAAGRDDDDDPLVYRYEWTVNDRPRHEQGDRLPTLRLRRGDEIQVRVVASDGIDESEPVRSGVVRVGNAHPEIHSAPSGVSDDGTFRYVIEARDPDGDRNLRYYLRKGPAGMLVNPIRGEVTWKATPQQAGTQPVEIVVEDSDGARTVQAFELTVTSEVDPSPAAPAP